MSPGRAARRRARALLEAGLAHRHRDGLGVRERPAPPGAVTIVWIHGLGESGLGFEQVMVAGELSRFGHLAPDLPGYGRSPWPAEPLSLAEHARHLRGWLERNTAGQLILVGHSMGGVIGTLLCERPGALEGRLAAFVDVEGNVSPTDCTNSATAAAYDLENFLDHGFARLADEVHTLGIADLANRSYYPSLRLADPHSFHLDSCELVEISERREMAGRLGALGLPCCYVHGRPGGAQVGSLELLRDAGVESIAIEPSGHWPFIDRRDDFVAVIADWLDRSIAIEATHP